MAFISCTQGNLKDVFITEAEIIDRFVGNRLWAWGENSFGQLGNNSTIDNGNNDVFTPVEGIPRETISRTTDWEQASVSCRHAAAVKTDGTLWLWGRNNFGQLGNNSSINRSSPVQTVSATTGWKQVSISDVHSAAIKTDGTLWLWGYNRNFISFGYYCGGILGNNSTLNRSSPVQTSCGGNNWKQVSLSSLTSAAIKTDGTLWIWGHGSQGQLGTGDTISQSNPVQTICSGNNWKQVSLAAFHSAAIKTDGTLWLWGNDGYGRLGRGSSGNSFSPIQTISSGNNWKQVALGGAHSASIKTDGTLWSWGRGSYGALGFPNSSNFSSPVQTALQGNNWKQVATSSDSCKSAAIKTDGTLWTWDPFVGSPTTIPRQTLCLGNTWKQVSTANYNTLAITFTEL